MRETNCGAQLCLLAAMTVAGSLLAASPAEAACRKQISITQLVGMSFGSIAPTAGGGSVALSSAGAVSGPAGFFFASSPVAPAAGQFRVTGSGNCLVFISFTQGSLLGPGAAMAVSNFTTNIGNFGFLSSGGTGQLTFNVGANLGVNANQVAGDYSGTYTVTVVY